MGFVPLLLAAFSNPMPRFVAVDPLGLGLHARESLPGPRPFSLFLWLPLPAPLPDEPPRCCSMRAAHSSSSRGVAGVDVVPEHRRLQLPRQILNGEIVKVARSL